ncbi:hypothetical protein EV44_g3771 [Erysiphe necator]|uniref:Uncharacterized protein n=1 Tax=Uncinula necator TaxID=52586 RepID=A0A0B1PE76_UNCNE|nr:hypothetical protein EV44_g3771 [Erysiphe necator]
MIHNRVQQLLDYMIQTIEPTLYERVIIANPMKKRTPTILYRAVKNVLKSFKNSAEIDLKTKLDRLERSSKTVNLDIWLNSWIQLEETAKVSNFTWADEVIDRFHAALSHRSIFFATSFAAFIWTGRIALTQLAEQHRQCEAKHKRFEHITSQELENFYKPPVTFALNNKTNTLENERNNEKKKRDQKKKDICACGIWSHNIKKCYFLNDDLRPHNWIDRRSKKKKIKTIQLSL